MRESRRAWLVIGVVLVASAVGRGDRSNRASASDDILPYARRPADVPAVGEEQAAPPDVPECRSDMVTLEVTRGPDYGAADPVGNETLVRHLLALMARPGEECALSAWPTLRLTTTEGTPDAMAPEPVAPRTERILLTGHQRVEGRMDRHSSCVPADSEEGIEVTLPSRDIVRHRLPDRPGCNPTLRHRNTWLFGWVEPAPPQGPPFEAELVDAPETIPHAGTLEVTVALTNPGIEPVSLDPCPVYRLAYGEGGTVADAVNELNCPAAPDRIPANGQLRFAAELELGDIAPGFVGGVMVQVFLDEGHHPALANAPFVRTE
jgi:hypothetical protein